MASNSNSIDVIQKEFDKWKVYHQIHAKSISELSPEINMILRKYAIKKLYDLAQAHPSMKQKVDDYFKLIFPKGQAEKIAKNFNVDKYCIYEDYTNLIEKIYEGAEEEYQSQIMQNEFSNYLELIAAYRLLVDMIELVSIWKEKDDNITKFQTFCKYRVVQIMDKKKNRKNVKGYDSVIEQEFQDLKKEIKQDEANSLSRAKTCIGTTGIEAKVGVGIGFGNQDVQMEDIRNDGNKNTNTNQDIQSNLKATKTMSINQRGDNTMNKIASNITGVKNPYCAISLDLNQQITLPQPQMQHQPQPLQQPQPQPYSQQNIQEHQMIQDQYQIKQQQQQQQQYPILSQNPPSQYPDFNQTLNYTPSIQNMSNNPLPPSRINPQMQGTTKSVLKRKTKKEQYNDEIEKLKREFEQMNDHPEEYKKKKEESTCKQQPLKPDVTNKKEMDIISNIFKQLSTPMLDDYIYDQNRVRISVPIKYQSNDYFGVTDYFKKTLIPSTMKEIQNSNYTKALENCEDILYCLTNILPKGA